MSPEVKGWHGLFWPRFLIPHHCSPVLQFSILIEALICSCHLDVYRISFTQIWLNEPMHLQSVGCFPNTMPTFELHPYSLHHLRCSTVEPTKDQNSAGCRESGINTEFLTLTNRSTAQVLLRAQWPTSFFIAKNTLLWYAIRWNMANPPFFFTPAAFCNVNMYYVNNISVVATLADQYYVR